MNRYNPNQIEPKWQAKWQQDQLYKAEDFSERDKFVMLTEFPYPSGAGLHLGHAREYVLGDIMARFKRMQGYNVLYPMGYDAFGLPTENYAIKHKIAPQVATADNIASFRQQFDALGLSIDWSRSFSTTDPDYYKWTQWLFLKFYEHGLAYQANVDINWCPKCKTGLANEEVIDGKHERCGHNVTKKQLKQWMLKITEYADKLIDGLENVDYPPRIASQQINWIGRSYGTEIKFKIDAHDLEIPVFTTRPDTLFGVSYLALAPENELLAKITSDEQRDKVNKYLRQVSSKSEVERQETDREKNGVFTGAYAIHPFTGENIPIWVADYVLMNYGTGAVMAVPAHDERDYQFATKFNLPIKQVIMPFAHDEIAPSKDNYETVNRDVVIVHLKDKSTGKFAILQGASDGIKTAIMGGIEPGQTIEEAALAELSQEAAINNAKLIKQCRWQTSTQYHDVHNSHNRKIVATTLLFEVDNLDEQGEISQTELDKHSLIWVDEKQVESQLSTKHQKLAWNILNNYQVITEPGILINSDQFNDLESEVAQNAITEELAKYGYGQQKINYRLRDWIFSRQHYWGEPIPIVHCAKCGAVPVPEAELPITLPEVKAYEPTDNGESPLSEIDDWVNTTCPVCGQPAKRETDTMPNWAGSSWYYLRYFDAHNDQAFASEDKLKYWGAVDMYLGGMEHTTLHLLYSRFWHQFFYEIGLVPTPEPYLARRGQGIVLAEDGTKMSKSKGNVINPIDIINSGYGADALRTFIAFIAPYDMTTAWNSEGVPGTYRFLNRVWNLVTDYKHSRKQGELAEDKVHQTIKKVTTDVQAMSFNTAVAALMELTNYLYKAKADGMKGKAWDFTIKALVQMTAPFAPHMAEELWRELGQTDSIHTSLWPEYDESKMVASTIKIAVSVNGKVRAEIVVPADATEDSVKDFALEQENVQRFTDGKEIKKIIYVPGRLVNIVAK